jgi:hypothetical protein
MAFEDTEEVIITGVKEEVIVIVGVEGDGVVAVVEGRVAGLASGIVAGFAALHVVFLLTSSYNSSLSEESEQLEDQAISYTEDPLTSLLAASI